MRKLVSMIREEKANGRTKLTKQLFSFIRRCSSESRDLDPKIFTAHMKTSLMSAFSPQMKKFTTDDTSSEHVSRGHYESTQSQISRNTRTVCRMSKARPKTAESYFQLSSKAMQQARLSSRRLEKCHSFLVYRKADASKLESYRPIAIPSHA